MKKFIPLLLLAGCASPSELRTQPPDLVAQTSRPPQAVAACITDAWDHIKVLGLNAEYSMRPLDNGLSLLIGNGTGQPSLLVDIRPGSLKGYTGSMGIMRGDDFLAAARGCA